MIELRSVCKSFGRVKAVDHVSFATREGEIFGLLGPNGAGKSTTIKIILNILAPDSGSVLFNGNPIREADKDRIGYLPEERGLYRKVKINEMLLYLASLKNADRSVAEKRLDEWLARFHLSEYKTRTPESLSKGMAQKVQFIASVLHDPELLLLDEPFSGLDPVNQQALEEVVRDLAARGATVVFSTHVMQHAERLCDQVVLIAGGKKAFDGTVEAARSSAPRTLVLEGALDPGAVGELPGVASVATEPLHGGGVRTTASLKPGAPAQETLREAFARGMDVGRFELREPTLHDAFIVLTGAELHP